MPEDVVHFARDPRTFRATGHFGPELLFLGLPDRERVLHAADDPDGERNGRHHDGDRQRPHHLHGGQLFADDLAGDGHVGMAVRVAEQRPRRGEVDQYGSDPHETVSASRGQGGEGDQRGQRVGPEAKRWHQSDAEDELRPFVPPAEHHRRRDSGEEPECGPPRRSERFGRREIALGAEDENAADHARRDRHHGEHHAQDTPRHALSVRKSAGPPASAEPILPGARNTTFVVTGSRAEDDAAASRSLVVCRVVHSVGKENP